MKMIKPIIILTIICLVSATALALTNNKTDGLIKRVTAQNLEKSKTVVLPNGTDGEAYQGVGKSFGGDLKVMVGIGTDGKITGVTVTSHSDTPGLGTKAMTTEYLKQYVGLSELPADHINKDNQVDAITGATISSNGVYCAVQNALSKGGK